MSAVPGAAGARVPSDDELWALLTQLIREGYHLVPQQLEAALAVVRSVRAEGPDVAGRWRYLLTPILATSASEQDDLMRRLSAARGPVVMGRTTSPPAPRPAPEIARRGRRWPTMVAGVGVLALCLLIAFRVYWPSIPPPTDTEGIQEAVEHAPGLDPVETETRTITTVFIVTSPLYGVVKWFLILAPLLALGGWLGHRWWLQRYWLSRNRSEGDLDLLDLGHRTAGRALFAGTELAGTAQQWRRFRHVPTRDLDPERTVAATLQEGGLFSPIYRTRPLTPEYVVLVEEESRHDHLARMADAAIDRLAAEDIEIERYYYQGGVAQLQSADNRKVTRSLTDLDALGPHRSLVVVGSGADLFEPLSARLDPHTAGLLEAWERRAFLSTRPIGAWADRELNLLDSGLALGTASRAGLKALGEHVASGHPGHARLLDGILVDRGSPPRPVAGDGPRVSLADLLEALRAGLRAALARNLAASVREALVDALRLFDNPAEVPRALDLIDQVNRLAGTEAVDSPRLLAAIRERLPAGRAAAHEPERSAARGRSKIFLGHAREDSSRVKELYDHLRALGFDPWLDSVDLLPGQRWQHEIERAIREAGAFLACLSTQSVEKRGFVQHELRLALQAVGERPPESIHLILVRLDECIVPDLQIPGYAASLANIHWVDLWEEGGFDRLVTALDRALGVLERGRVPQYAAPPTVAETEEQALEPGTVFRDVDAPWCPEMVVVPAGSFVMGSPADEEGRRTDEGPRRTVRMGRPFALGRYPVTFEEYDHFCDATGRRKPNDNGWGRGRRPAIDVAWEDAEAYCAWLSAMTRRSYRLPSEAEWEYACRAGTTTPFWTGTTIATDQANYNGNHTYGGGKQGEYRRQTTPVDGFGASPWGLHDMHGNVWEWCADRWHDSYEGAPDDGSAWLEGKNSGRVVRGGSWGTFPEGARSAYRDWYEPDHRFDDLGFRVSRTLTP